MGIRGYPLVLVVKSLVNHRVILFLRLNSLGFRGYPVCLSSNRLQITGYPCFRVWIPCVFARIRGYPFRLVRQGGKSHFRKVAVALGFRGYPEVSVGFGGQISCKS